MLNNSLSRLEMAIPAHTETLLKMAGPIDGRHFFSRSPMRSSYFIIVTFTCFAGIVYDLYLLLTH